MQHHLLGVDTGRIDAEPDAEVVKLLDDRALPHLLERRLGIFGGMRSVAIFIASFLFQKNF